MLRKPLRDLALGSYDNLAVAQMDTPVMDVIHLLVKRNISCVPILDRDGTLLNVFEAVDVITLIKGGDYEKLNLTAGRALELRPEVRGARARTLSYRQYADLRTCTGLPRYLHLHSKRPSRYHLRHDPQVARPPASHYRRGQATQGRAFAERYPGLHAQ